MKNSILITLTALILTACGGGELSDLETLVAQKDSLNEVKVGLSEAIIALELQIKDLDTTKKKALVSVENAQIENFKHFFQVYGTVQSDQNVQVYSELSGKIMDFKVEEGDRVSKGQVMVVVDVSVLQNQERELNTRLELAETTFQKQKRLWDQNIGSEMQYLQAKSNRDGIKSSLKTLQSQIAMGNIKAAFSGIVDETFIKEGEMAMPGMPLLRLVNLNEVFIKADVSENYLGRVKEGDKVVVSLPSVGVNLSSTIERTGQFINEANRTFKIKTTIKNTDQVLKPNMVALLEIEDFSADSSVVIPTSLLLQGAGGVQYVYVVGNSSIVKKTPVTVGMTYKDKALITEGLIGNEVIVDKGARSIRDGEQVNIKN
ncbi:MAG: efflux RND transporter periplasmic adaptor subunit [Salibacteraceae bacterium]